jgi:DNA-binding response OmpR family regulator
MNILLIEDDSALSEALRKALAERGFVVNTVARGQLGLNAIMTDLPDVVILDLGLPDLDGMTVLRRIRDTNKDLPVLLLTARDSLDDKVAGLDSGADDYLTKPFDMAELLARLRVLERRLSTSRTSVICIGAVSLDTARGLVSVDGKPVELPRREFMLLRVLMENAGKVLTRGSLESRLYSWGEEVASNTVEVHVHHLRKKLGTDFIGTVRGVGYRVAEQ